MAKRAPTELAQSTRHVFRSFAQNLRQVVETIEDDGAATQRRRAGIGGMTNQQLAGIAGIRPSTLSKIIPARSSDIEDQNMSMDSVCRLADALGMSPALLLMTPEDWKSLISGFTFVFQILQASDEKKEELGLNAASRYLMEDSSPKIDELAKYSNRLAMEVLESNGTSQEKRTEMEAGIRKCVAMAMAPGLDPNERLMVLMLAAAIGPVSRPQNYPTSSETT